ncbi:MAG TPA: hypothetical protein VIQ31_14845 [Phormidium sp.]
MPRKSTKNLENYTQQIDAALNEPVGKYLSEEAERLGISDIELKERFAAKVDNDDALDWEIILPEFQPHLEAIEREIDAEKSVRRLESTKAPEISQESVPIEPPIIEEEPQQKKRGGRPKKESTALTQTKSTKLKESDKKSQQLGTAEQQVKVKLHAIKGQKSGAQLATVELAAEDATYRQIKGQALVRKVGQLTKEIAAESEFDPIEILAEMGIDSNSEIFEDLREQLEPTLGKLESATAEIVENAWVNGIDLKAEVSALEELLSSNGSISDFWQ